MEPLKIMVSIFNKSEDVACLVTEDCRNEKATQVEEKVPHVWRMFLEIEFALELFTAQSCELICANFE